MEDNLYTVILLGKIMMRTTNTTLIWLLTFHIDNYKFRVKSYRCKYLKIIYSSHDIPSIPVYIWLNCFHFLSRNAIRRQTLHGTSMHPTNVKHYPAVLFLFASANVLSCVQLCSLMDCSWPGFSVHGIFQARILE